MKFFRVPFNPEEGMSPHQPNPLHEYIQSQSMQDMARLASEISPQVKQIIAGNVQALLGHLSGQEFQTTVAADKGSFQNLLASAMVTGYFMHAMENRMKMESLFEVTEDSDMKAEEPDVPHASESAASKEPTNNMHQALEALIKSRLKKPEDLFGGLEKQLENLENLDNLKKADQLGEFISSEAFKSKAYQAHQKAPAEKKSDTLKIQLEINTEMGQDALTNLIQALGTLRQQP